MGGLFRRYWKPASLALLTVVVLALVILGGSFFSKPKAAQTNTLGANAAQQNNDLMDRAESALSSGDTSSAVALARRVLVTDPGNKRAIVVVRTVTAGGVASTGKSGGATAASTTPSGSQESSNTASGTQTPVDDSAFMGRIDFIAMLPKKYAGYSIGQAASDSANVDMSAVPEAANAPAFRIGWAVHDRGTVKAANDFIRKTSMVLYPKSADGKLSIDGATGYFGTDGTELATVAYRRGRYVFEVVVVAQTQGKPEKLRPLAIAAARAFSDKP